MPHLEATQFFLALGVILATARILGELAVRLRQPAVLGEILAGILLGPTVFGALAPEWCNALFPQTGAFPIALDGVTSLSIALFLLVAGMEVDLSTVWRQGRTAFIVSVFGMSIPFIVGFSSAWFFPTLMGVEETVQPVVFALFLATAFSISALPVISKILMDLNLFRSDIGMIIIGAAILNDLTGWLVFALVLSLMDGARHTHLGLPATIGVILSFSAVLLTVGRWAVDKALPWIQARTTWPAGVLGFALTGALLCSAFTEWAGIHAVFGAFLFGVVLGDSRHLRERTRATLMQFISFVFAPLFFASIGLRVDFAAHFDPLLVLFVLVIATASKVFGCTLGARLGGIAPRQSLAVGFGMSSLGAMGIILGLLAMDVGLISARVFVALVILSLVTSMFSGSLLQLLLRPKRAVRFFDHLSGRTFCPALHARDRRGVIEELARSAASAAGMPAETLFYFVWQREMAMSTSLEHGIAAPHARIEGLKAPVVAAGLSEEGVDFDAMDGQPAHVIFMILTPLKDYQTQLEILADVGRTFRGAEMVERAAQSKSFTQFIALVKSGLQ